MNKEDRELVIDEKVFLGLKAFHCLRLDVGSEATKKMNIFH